MDQETVAKIVGDLYLNYHLLSKRYDEREKEFAAKVAELEKENRQLKDLIGSSIDNGRPPALASIN
jgi:hypothetical protein